MKKIWLYKEKLRRNKEIEGSKRKIGAKNGRVSEKNIVFSVFVVEIKIIVGQLPMLSSPILNAERGQGITTSGFNFHIGWGDGSWRRGFYVIMRGKKFCFV